MTIKIETDINGYGTAVLSCEGIVQAEFIHGNSGSNEIECDSDYGVWDVSKVTSGLKLFFYSK